MSEGWHEWPSYYSPPDPIDDDWPRSRPMCNLYPNCQGDEDECCDEFLQFKGDTACGTCYHLKECH